VLVADTSPESLEFRDAPSPGVRVPWVQVVNSAIDGSQRLLQCSARRFTTRGTMSIAIGRGAIAEHFGINLRTASPGRARVFRPRPLPPAASDDKNRTLLSVSRGSFLWGVVLLGGKGAHRIETALECDQCSSFRRRRQDPYPALPQLICSMACPKRQWRLGGARERRSSRLIPLILNGVARQADTVLPWRGTR